MNELSAAVMDVANYLPGESLETAERQAVGVVAAELSGHLSLTGESF